MDKSLRNTLIGCLLLIAVAIFYYFFLKPREEQRAYSDCMEVLMQTGFNSVTINSPFGKSSLETCTKSRGAQKILEEERLKAEAAEIERAANQAAEAAKKLSPIQLNNIELKDLKFTDEGYAGTLVSGQIVNSNSIDVSNIVLNFIIASDKGGKNKIDDKDCKINDFVVYANTTKSFNLHCSIANGWIWTALKSAEKNKN